MRKISVNTPPDAYQVLIKPGLLKAIPEKIKVIDPGNLGILITCRRLEKIYRKQISNTFKGRGFKLLKVPDGEKAKSLNCFITIIRKFIKHDNWNKRLYVICLGGGVVGDLGAFSASLYKRGIPCIQIPTTLLSQIDASVGGKTAIDMPEAKNLIGTFYQPKSVFIDPLFLKTLPEKEIRQGMAEAIKYSIISGKRLFAFLSENCKNIIKRNPETMEKLIYKCLKVKAEIVEKDPLEKTGIRALLNFGHTLAHALEATGRYRGLSHGEAVGLGISYACDLSVLLGLCPEKEAGRIKGLLNAYSLPSKIKINPQTVYKAMTYDKKFINGKFRLVLLNKIGSTKVVDGISPKLIKKTLNKLT